MQTILFERALSFEERPFDVLDLVLAGLAETSWQKLEADAAAGVAAEQELDSRGAGPSIAEVQKAERAFRYERGLLAAADLEQWLAARRLARGEWRGVLRRALAREWLRPTASADATPVLRADAYCTGALGRCALRLVAGVAAEGALGTSEDDERVAARILEAAQASTASSLETVADVELERRARTQEDRSGRGRAAAAARGLLRRPSGAGTRAARAAVGDPAHDPVAGPRALGAARARRKHIAGDGIRAGCGGRRRLRGVADCGMPAGATRALRARAARPDRRSSPLIHELSA